MADSLTFTGGRKIVVRGETFTLSPSQLEFEPESVLSGLQAGAELDLSPAVFSLIATYLSGYTLTSIAPVAGLSQQDTAAAVRRDAERLGLTKLVELVDSFRGSRKPSSPRIRSASDAPAPAQTPEELAKGVYLRGVQREVSKAQLTEALSGFGPLVNVRVVYTKRCAFADFETEESAKAAIAASSATNGLEINGVRVKVDARQPGLRKGGRNGARGQSNGQGDESAGQVIHEDDEDEVDHDGQA